MKRTILPVLAACAMLAASPALAQIKVTNFTESYGAEQPVSGRGFVGAVVADAATAVSLATLEIYVPPGTTGAIKVSVISADAKYRATAEATLTGSEKGWTKLPLVTKQGAALAAYTTDSLTLLAETPNEKPLLMRWGGAAAKTVQVYVNSERSDTSIAWKKDGKVEIRDCRRLSGGSLVRFDTICTAPADVLGPEPIRIIRRRGGVALEPLQVPLAALQ